MKRQIFAFILILLSSFALAQADNPVAVRLEIYVVSMVNGKEEFKESSTARPGQIVEYRLFAANKGDTTLPPGSVTITGPVPEGTTYIADSATPSSDEILTEFTVNGSDFVDNEVVATSEGGTLSAVRWTVEVDMEPGKEQAFVYRVTVDKEN